ncbi:MAG: M28 family peptidase, partial [Melioribacteraceae bacterium]|nr:M28 family peptidase [Melioribacteraceae bacterium]
MDFIKLKAILLFSSLAIIPQNNENKIIPNSEINLLIKHTEVLGSDLFEGRGTGTKGGELAANYISSIYKKNGLIPIGEDSTYFQGIPLHGTNYLEDTKLLLIADRDTLSLKICQDYLLSNLGEQTIIPTAIDLIYVSYGIVAPEFDHNDYLGKDVFGKIVVMLEGEPYSIDKDYFRGDEPTIYTHHEVKHRIALSRGAAGTIILSKANENSWKRLRTEYSFEDVNLSYSPSSSFSMILNPKISNALFSYDSNDSGDFLNRKKVERYSLIFEGQFFVRDFKAYNVVGMIRGKQRKVDEEFIIVSAHYDHLGIGPDLKGDKIYNGVLDNAIGVSGLLEVARVLSGYKKYLNRSIIFIATTGEEKGLLGSTYYVDNPIYPLYKTVANINIDGMAFLDDFKSVVGVGAELSNLDSYL